MLQERGGLIIHERRALRSGGMKREDENLHTGGEQGALDRSKQLICRKRKIGKVNRYRCF